MRYLLDTVVISELLASEPAVKVMQWVDQLPVEAVYVSVITLGELRKGVEKLDDNHRRHTLRRWLFDDLVSRFDGKILPIDTEVMLEWGEMMAELERDGHTMATTDSLIAALARRHACTLVTCNEADFKGAGISIANPWK